MEAPGEICFVNQAALSLLGLSESQLLGQTPVDPDWHIIQKDGKPFQLKFQPVPIRARNTLMLLISRQGLRNLVLGVYRPASGDRIWLSVNTEPKIGLDGCVERVTCTLSDITNLMAEEKFSKIHEGFLSLGSDPDENINRLTALAGELLGGTWALYNRQHQGLMWTLGEWHAPPDYMHVGEPKHYICNEVIERGSNQVFVLQDLQKTSYAQSNPYIDSYQLQTYVGQAVKCGGEYIGALCMVYQNHFVPSQADKKLMGIIAAAIGVEEERKREATVWAQNEVKWRALIQTSSNLIAIVEGDCTIKYASPAIQGVLGYKPKELIGKNAVELVHPEDAPSVKKDFQNALQNPTRDLSVEFRFRHKDGSWRYIESTYSNLLMDSPVQRIVVNFRDVTERKLAEAALRESEAQLREKAAQLEQALQELQETQTQLIQTEKMSSLGLLVAGIAHEINNPVSFIYGNIPHATQYAQDLLHLIDLYRQQCPHPSPAIQAEMETIDLDFLSKDLPKVMESMQMGAERIRQIVMSLRNFSRLDRAAKEPVDLHQGIDSTLLLLRHRIKAKAERPEIRVIKEYGDLPLVECHAGQINQVFMNILTNAIDALEELNVGRLNVEGSEELKVGRLNVEGSEELKVGRLNVEGSEELKVARLNVKGSQKNLQPANLQPATETNLQPVTPIIRIRTEVGEGNTVIIRIADNGPGIPPQMQQQIFDPFFTTKPVGQGTGLGLSITYQIVVEKHGGQLKCFSTPGEGTEFAIELPVKLPHQQAQ